MPRILLEAWVIERRGVVSPNRINLFMDDFDCLQGVSMQKQAIHKLIQRRIIIIRGSIVMPLVVFCMANAQILQTTRTM